MKTQFVMTKYLLFLCLIFSTQTNLYSQLYPVDLGIRNISQEMDSWCWVAVSEQIISWNNGRSPSQCELVAVASRIDPRICCNYPSRCNRSGGTDEIMKLIRYYGGRTSSIAPPTDPMTLYRTLRSGRAIILRIRTSPYSRHVVVLRGMKWVNYGYGLEPIFYVNDPLDYFTRPVSFEQLIRIWDFAIVID